MQKKAVRTAVRSGLKRIKSSKDVSSWANAFSNNLLPPVILLFISIVTLHFAPLASTALLRANLGAVSLASAALSLYIITLML